VIYKGQIALNMTFPQVMNRGKIFLSTSSQKPQILMSQEMRYFRTIIVCKEFSSVIASNIRIRPFPVNHGKILS
jgi:hypothetical protein